MYGELESKIRGLEVFGAVRIDEAEGKLTATLRDREDNQYNISALNFEGDILSFDVVVTAAGDKPLSAWLKVDGTQLNGALGGEHEGMAVDFPLKGRKR